MPSTLSVRELINRLGETCALQLHPQGKQAALENPVGRERRQDRPIPLTGYLNFVHPPQVQVVAEAELEYIQGMDDDRMARNLLALQEHDTAVVIFANHLPVPEVFLKGLNNAGIAILNTEIPGHKLLYRLRHFLSESLAPQMTLHGVFLEILGIGVLITGKSGIGKSELALELVSRGHRLVADDAPEFSRHSPDWISGTSPEVLRNFLEVRGLGILDVRAMFGQSSVRQQKKLELIIHLVPAREGQHLPHEERLAGSRTEMEIFEVKIPQISIPVVPGHNLGVLVEAACRDHILRQQGYAAEEVFARRQLEAMRQDQDSE